MGKGDEEVLVLPREVILSTPWTGINQGGITGFEELVKSSGQFRRRSEVEEDPNWKQIIPYLVFRYQGKYWVMQRTTKGGEERLHNLFSLGISGHVRKEDLDGGNITEWARREFEEEIDYQGHLVHHPLGLLNDESIPVNRVHLGLVILLEGDSNQIKVKEDHNQNGRLLTLDQIGQNYQNLESWSQIVFDFLRVNII